MTYAGKDISVHDGMPMEFYRFDGSLRTYFFTDQANPVVLAGSTYLPIQLERGNVGVSSVSDGQRTLMISIPANSSLAEDYGGRLTPNSLRLTMYRAYRGDDLNSDFRQRFEGAATRYGFDNHTFVMEFSNLLSSDLDKPVREVYYQSVCNHILYDERCKANRAANTAASEVVEFNDQAVEVVDDGWADGDLIAGSLINIRTGEERLIIDNLANVVEIGYPFVDIRVGDEVQLVRGCNHGTSDCVGKFNNFDNYGGFLYLPYKNPFENGI